jgi:hypothetical protein
MTSFSSESLLNLVAAVARSIGFSAQDLGKIQRMVKSHQSSLKEAWNAFFGT